MGLTKPGNKKRYKKIIVILIFSGIFSILGITFQILMMFSNNQYTAFIYNFLVELSIAGISLSICIFFLYACFVILFFNPQQLKNSVRFGWGFGGLISLTILIITIVVASNRTIASINDIADYKNGNWEIQNATIEKVYWGSNSQNGLITTDIGEFVLPKKLVRLHIGEQYELTYLKHTETIIQVNKLK